MKISKSIIAIIFITIFIGNAFGQNLNKTEANKVWQMLETAQTEDAFWYLVNLYRQNGADFDIGGKNGLKLQIQDYKEIINSYSNGSVTITLSRMMKPEETTEYWESWSKVLAQGNFDQKKFFKDDRERFLMANFNVLVLAAHEIGHYLDYRYLINDRLFEGGMLATKAPMNCVENYADKFAVAVINYLSQDSRFAELRPRYLELIKNFNNVIPAENRYHFDTYDYVGEKCGTVDLYKNGVNEDGNGVNENFFRQYVSAYFNRHRLMLENKDYPDLKKVIEQDLVEPFFKMVKFSETKLTVRTLGEFNLKLNHDIFYGGDGMREMIDFNRTLNSDEKPKENVPVSLKTNLINDKGEIRTLELSWIAKELLNEDEKIILRENGFELKILNAQQKVTDSIKVTVPKELQNEFIITKTVLPTDNEVVAILMPFDLKKKSDYVVVLHLLKEKKKWREKFVKFTLPNLKNADEIAESWFMTPSGKLNLLQRIEKEDGNFHLTQYEIERTSFTPQLKRQTFIAKLEKGLYTNSRQKALWLDYDWGQTIAGNDSGKLIIEGSERDANFISNSGKESLFEVGETGKTLLSNFSGIVDGENPRQIRVSNIGETRFLSENRLVFIDNSGGKTYLRELVFH